MFPIERNLGDLKDYVRNRSKPEGSIAEGYIVEECLSFCSMYLKDVETRRTRVGRNTFDGSDMLREGFSVFDGQGRKLGKGPGESVYLVHDVLARVHRYILFNCPEAKPYLDKHLENARKIARRRRITRKQAEIEANDSFPGWFQDQVEQEINDGVELQEDLVALAKGPNQWALRYKSFVINGCRFRIKEVDVRKKNQNSGMFVLAAISSYASCHDRNPRVGDVGFYGVLTDILELNYGGDRRIVVFDGEWVDTSLGIRIDEFGFTSVNFGRQLATNDTFVLAPQVVQVYYVQDPIDIDWYVVVKSQPRDLFDLNSVNQPSVCHEQTLDEVVDTDDIDPRTDIEGTTVDHPLTPPTSPLQSDA